MPNMHTVSTNKKYAKYALHVSMHTQFAENSAFILLFILFNNIQSKNFVVSDIYAFGNLNTHIWRGKYSYAFATFLRNNYSVFSKF